MCSVFLIVDMLARVIEDFLQDSKLINPPQGNCIHTAAVLQNSARDAVQEGDLLKDFSIYPLVQDTWTSMGGKAEFATAVPSC